MFELRKIGIVKRLSAQLLDLILLAVLATGFIFIISLICNYTAAEQLATQYYEEWEDYRKEYAGDVAAHYGFQYEESEDGSTYTVKNEKGEQSSLSELMKKLSDSNGEDAAVKEAYEAFTKLPPSNEQAMYVYSLLFMMISIGLLLSYIVLEFILPIIFKNGQTVGKKVFGICLVRPDCVKITNMALFVRTLLGKYVIETMFPILLIYMFFFMGLGILAIILFIALELLNIILFFVTKNRTPIHDLVAGTVATDAKLQMIFQSEQELIDKKTLKQKETVENSKS